MSNPVIHNFSPSLCIECIRSKQEPVHEWLQSLERSLMPPIYSSVDIRDAGFKIAVVDTNLFPAGFNNLCEHGIEDSIKYIKQAIERRAPGGKDILIVAEEHTRNVWYLEHIRILQKIIQDAGYNAVIATFLTVQPEFCESAHAVELETATGQQVKIFCFKRILNKIQAGEQRYDLIIMNNDLSAGIPDILRETDIPIYPSIHAGWHSRKKSSHFHHMTELIREFARMVNLDPWLFSCFFTSMDGVNINSDEDRKKLADAAAKIFEQVEAKYKKHNVVEKPFVFLKSDSGTYGMGVEPIEHPEDILKLNRKDKNKLYKGKSSQVISRFLIQEGVETIHSIESQVSEVSIYQIDNNLVGGFYRTHSSKGSRENLNSPGMEFKKMCPRLSRYGDCGVHHDMNIFDVYRILARIAGIAARMEIVELEEKRS
ncbi:MAG: glutamate--cysteine ligase [Candidatus Omnitrophota bacterium]|nr:glutamate--cysteine ligase [Candidatus Omnitrophota bacterium]MDZ4242632.1 glutamate--cysteine ligase [Candidatus Omnitrophota bacterium]